jgi:hypothetical protein
MITDKQLEWLRDHVHSGYGVGNVLDSTYSFVTVRDLAEAAITARKQVAELQSKLNSAHIVGQQLMDDGNSAHLELESVRLQAQKWEKRARVFLEGMREIRAEATLQEITCIMAQDKMVRARDERDAARAVADHMLLRIAAIKRDLSVLEYMAANARDEGVADED